MTTALKDGSKDSLTQPISILLVDDHSHFREGLQHLLDFYNSTGNEQFQVVGRAASVQQAMQLVEEQHPSLVLLDLEFEQGDGLQFLAKYRTHKRAGKVLVLSGHDDDEWVFKAMQAGARGYVFKQKLSTQLCHAIKTVMNDEIYLTSEMATRFFRYFHFHAGQSLKATATLRLTEREREVLACLVEGNSNALISRRLHITVGTVKAYLRCIFEKMEVDSRTQAALKALKLGLV